MIWVYTYVHRPIPVRRREARGAGNEHGYKTHICCEITVFRMGERESMLHTMGADDDDTRGNLVMPGEFQRPPAFLSFFPSRPWTRESEVAEGDKRQWGHALGDFCVRLKAPNDVSPADVAFSSIQPTADNFPSSITASSSSSEELRPDEIYSSLADGLMMAAPGWWLWLWWTYEGVEPCVCVSCVCQREQPTYLSQIRRGRRRRS